MIKRISLLVTAALLVATMAMAGLAGPAFANNKSDCSDGGGTWNNQTKTCTTENGNPPTSNSPVLTVEKKHDSGNGGTLSRDKVTPADNR